jgi:hypothetical protein
MKLAYPLKVVFGDGRSVDLRSVTPPPKPILAIAPLFLNWNFGELSHSNLLRKLIALKGISAGTTGPGRGTSVSLFFSSNTSKSE